MDFAEGQKDLITSGGEKDKVTIRWVRLSVLGGSIIHRG